MHLSHAFSLNKGYKVGKLIEWIKMQIMNCKQDNNARITWPDILSKNIPLKRRDSSRYLTAMITSLPAPWTARLEPAQLYYAAKYSDNLDSQVS